MSVHRPTRQRQAREPARVELPPRHQSNRLRIGQRGKGTDGWVHLDCHPSADIVATIPPLPACVLGRRWQVIEGIHVWEHFYSWEAEQLAQSIHAALAVGGQLILECPNLAVACRSFLGQYRDADSYHMHVFYGDPQRRDPSYCHRWGYTPQTLRQQLIECGGFQAADVRIQPARFHVPDRDFCVVATKRAT